MCELCVCERERAGKVAVGCLREGNRGIGCWSEHSRFLPCTGDGAPEIWRAVRRDLMPCTCTGRHVCIMVGNDTTYLKATLLASVTSTTY